MDGFNQGSIAYISSLCTIFILFPYRDYVKLFSTDTFKAVNVIEFSKWRYRGIVANYHQPLILAVPWGFLYGGFASCNGGIVGGLIGAFLFGNSKTVVKHLSSKMSGGEKRYGKLGQRTTHTVIDCIRRSTVQFGPLSFFCGGTAASLIAFLWHSITLISLQSREMSSSSFFSDFIGAFRIHALLTILTNPLRNSLRSGMHQPDRPGGVFNFRSYLACERQIYQEGRSVFFAMLRTEGLSFFTYGALRTVFKTSLPFAVTYGLFKSLGGHLGSGLRRRRRNAPYHNLY